MIQHTMITLAALETRDERAAAALWTLRNGLDERGKAVGSTAGLCNSSHTFAQSSQSRDNSARRAGYERAEGPSRHRERERERERERKNCALKQPLQ